MLKSQIAKEWNITQEEKNYFNCLMRVCYACKLGSLIKQEVDIASEYYERVKSYWFVIRYFLSISSPFWLNIKHLELWLKGVIIDNQAVIQPLVLFCPSYLKDGNPGLSGQIGYTTKVGIRNTISFVSTLQELLKGYATIKPVIDFGTLALEQYEKQHLEKWLIQLEDNRQMIQEEFKNLGFHCVIRRTDDISELKELIGYNGNINEEIIEKNKDRTKAVFDRNNSFYIEKMGWNKDLAEIRTKISLSSYDTASTYYKKTLENPILFYTSNSYEKGIAYNLSNQNLLIIYPKKDDNQNILELQLSN